MKFDHIEKKHVTQAIDYIISNGEAEKEHGILSVRAERPPQSWAIIHKKYRIGVKNALRVAHYYAKNQNPDKCIVFTTKDKKGLGKFKPDNGANRLKYLGFKVCNFNNP